MRTTSVWRSSTLRRSRRHTSSSCPKQHFASAAEATEENAAVIGHIYAVIAKIAKEQGFADGYRVVTNVGELAGQTVHHIHFHVLSGKQLGSFN